MKKHLKYIFIFPLLALSACGDTPPKSLDVIFPSSWRASSDVVQGPAPATPEAPQPVAPQNWWKAFGDPALDQLVAQALEKNNDLAIAMINLRQARLQLDLAKDSARPQVDGGISAGRSFDLESGNKSWSFGTSLGISYAADIWGKIGKGTDNAKLEAAASSEDLESAAQTLAYTAATLYWQIGLDAEQIKASSQSIEYAEKSLSLAVSSHDAGASSGLDVIQAEQSVASQKASHTQLLQQAEVNKNALAALLGRPPGDLPATATSLPTHALPVVAAGIPAGLLNRRPDIRAAELRLQKSLNGVDITKAELLPGLSLTGSFGTSSTFLADILKNPAAALGAGISLPFLQWNQRQINIKSAEVDYEKAVISLRQKVYVTLGEVDNALIARQALEVQAALLEKSYNDTLKAEKMYEERYKAGAEPIRTFLDAQERTRQAHLQLLQNYYSRLVNHATLCLALGGPATTDLHLESKVSP